MVSILAQPYGHRLEHGSSGIPSEGVVEGNGNKHGRNQCGTKGFLVPEYVSDLFCLFNPFYFYFHALTKSSNQNDFNILCIFALYPV